MTLGFGTAPSGPLPTRRPLRWHGAGAAAAAVGGRVILFGGDDGNGAALQDTWSWDGHTWTDLTPTPPALSPTAVYDGTASEWEGTFVLFGGFDPDSGVFLNDTWVLNGTTWTPQPATAIWPTGRQSPASASANGVIVLFGGLDNDGDPLGDTWIWNGSDWTKGPASGPSPRCRSDNDRALPQQ